MKIIVLIIVFIAIAFYEIPGLKKKKLWDELSVVSILLVIGFTLSLLQVIGVKVPNPNKGIEYLVKLFIRI